MKIIYSLLVAILMNINVIGQCYIDYSNYQLILDEQFDTYSGDVNKVFDQSTLWYWLPDDPLGGWGYEVYDKNNVLLVSDGNGGYRLRLRATPFPFGSYLNLPGRLEKNGTPKKICYRSGMITIKKNQDLPPNSVLDVNNCTMPGTNQITNDRGLQYGMIEIRCRLPYEIKNKWDSWPAFWMLGGKLEIDGIDNIADNIGNMYQAQVIDWGKQPWTINNSDWQAIAPDPNLPEWNGENYYSIGDKVKS